MQFKLTSVSQLPQIAEEIKIGRQLQDSSIRVLENIIRGNGYRKMEDVDIRKPLYLGVLPYGGDRYALFLNVTSEIERVVKENVRSILIEFKIFSKKFYLTNPFEMASWPSKVFPSSSIDRKKYDLNTKEGTKKFNDFVKQKYMGKWDYKRTHPIFSKVQGKVDRYSKYFVYAKAPNKLITYDFLGNYNYAVTGMYVLMFTGESRSKGILTWVNEHNSGGITDKGDREAVALGEKNYRQYS